MSPKKTRKKRSFEPQDRYFHEAKKRGYKSRAAFKLLEMERKYRFLKKGHRVIDLGAAPGGWSQVALEAVGANGRVLGVDLTEITGITAPNFAFLQADLREEATIARIKAQVGMADVILSDMAPATSGVKFQDHARSMELAEITLELATQLLRAGGFCVIKIFPGEELAPFKKKLTQHFQQVHEFIPEATRKTSREIYLVARVFLSLKK